MYWLLTKTDQELKDLKESKKSKEYEIKAKMYILKCLEGCKTNPGKTCSFLCGEVGIFALAAVLLKETQYVKKILEWKKRALLNASNEVLFGKSGYLSALLFVRDHFLTSKTLDSKTLDNRCTESNNRYSNSHNSNSHDKSNIQDHSNDKLARKIQRAIEKIGSQIISEGEKQDRDTKKNKRNEKAATTHSYLTWTWHGKEYLGGAHGTAGILSLLISAGCNSPRIWETVDFLHSQKLPSGNYPTQNQGHKDELVQFCHGAPGIGMLFVQCARTTMNSKYIEWAESCAEFTVKRGFLKKGNSMCHGVCGNAFLFLQLWELTRKEKWLTWAKAFGVALVTNPTSASLWSQADQPHCFANGLAGAVYFYSVLRLATDQSTRDYDEHAHDTSLTEFPLLLKRCPPLTKELTALPSPTGVSKHKEHKKEHKDHKDHEDTKHYESHSTKTKHSSAPGHQKEKKQRKKSH